MGTPLPLPCRGVLTFCFLLYHRGGRFTVHARVHERLDRAQLGGRARAAEALYILGDFFEAWIGDDAMSPYQSSICEALPGVSAGWK